MASFPGGFQMAPRHAPRHSGRLPDDDAELSLSADMLLSMDSTAESLGLGTPLSAGPLSMPFSFDDDGDYVPPAPPSERPEEPLLFEDLLLALQEAHDGEVTGLREENAELHQEFVAEFGPLAALRSSAAPRSPRAGADSRRSESRGGGETAGPRRFCQRRAARLMEESLAARDLEEQRLAGAEPPAKRRRLEGGFGGSPAWAWARSLMFWRPSRKSLEPPPWPSRGRAAHGLFAKSMARPPWHAEGAPGAAEPTEEGAAEAAAGSPSWKRGTSGQVKGARAKSAAAPPGKLSEGRNPWAKSRVRKPGPILGTQDGGGMDEAEPPRGPAPFARAKSKMRKENPSLWAARTGRFDELILALQKAYAGEVDTLRNEVQEAYNGLAGVQGDQVHEVEALRNQLVRVLGSKRSHADSWNRIRDKQRIEEDLGLDEHGSQKVIFVDPKEPNTVVARGYRRILYGDHGPYIECRHDQVNWKMFPKVWRKSRMAYYDEHYTASGFVKAYEQKKTVGDRPNPPREGRWSCRNNRWETGYADYQPGVVYMAADSLEVRRHTWACREDAGMLPADSDEMLSGLAFASNLRPPPKESSEPMKSPTNNPDEFAMDFGRLDLIRLPSEDSFAPEESPGEIVDLASGDSLDLTRPTISMSSAVLSAKPKSKLRRPSSSILAPLEIASEPSFEIDASAAVFAAVPKRRAQPPLGPDAAAPATAPAAATAAEGADAIDGDVEAVAAASADAAADPAGEAAEDAGAATAAVPETGAGAEAGPGTDAAGDGDAETGHAMVAETEAEAEAEAEAKVEAEVEAEAEAVAEAEANMDVATTEAAAGEAATEEADRMLVAD